MNEIIVTKADIHEKSVMPKSAIPEQVSSRELLGQRKELIILHNDERYILRVTGNNKLILTK